MNKYAVSTTFLGKLTLLISLILGGALSTTPRALAGADIAGEPAAVSAPAKKKATAKKATKPRRGRAKHSSGAKGAKKAPAAWHSPNGAKASRTTSHRHASKGSPKAKATGKHQSHAAAKKATPPPPKPAAKQAAAPAPAPAVKPAAVATKPIPAAATPNSATQDKTKSKKPKAKGKSLSAKALDDPDSKGAADGDAAVVDGDEGEDTGAGPFLLIFVMFIAASAGTFYYLRRKNEQDHAPRGDESFASANNPEAFNSAFSSLDQGTLAPHGEGTNAHVTQVGLAPSISPTLTEHTKTRNNPKPATLPRDTGLQESGDPCSFERFVEVHVAQGCWAEQGLDIVANLQSHFHMNMLDWSKINGYWNQKYLADDRLMRQFVALEATFKPKYSGSAAS